MYGPHDSKKFANTLKGVYWVNSLSNEKPTEKFSKGSLQEVGEILMHKYVSKSGKDVGNRIFVAERDVEMTIERNALGDSTLMSH